MGDGYFKGVSIHAPVRGATMSLGVDYNLVYVSIHAPVRGATYDIHKMILEKSVSIHAPVRGATENVERAPVQGVFQSTRPCGARHT